MPKNLLSHWSPCLALAGPPPPRRLNRANPGAWRSALRGGIIPIEWQWRPLEPFNVYFLRESREIHYSEECHRQYDKSSGRPSSRGKGSSSRGGCIILLFGEMKRVFTGCGDSGSDLGGVDAAALVSKLMKAIPSPILFVTKIPECWQLLLPSAVVFFFFSASLVGVLRNEG